MKTREKAVALLRYLSGNETSGENYWENPVRIGDVLEKHSKLLDKIPIEVSYEEAKKRAEKSYPNFPKHYSIKDIVFEIVALWELAGGFTGSLNDIFDSEIDYEFCDHSEKPIDCFLDENIQNLLDFLWEIFGEKIIDSQKKR